MAQAKKTKSGNYRVQVFDYKDEHGKNHYKSFTARTKREAEFKASLYVRVEKSSTEDKTTVYEAVKGFIEAKENILSESTIRSYKNILEKHFQNTKIGEMRLDKLDSLYVQKWVNGLYDGKRSAKTVANIFGLFRSSIKLSGYKVDLNISLPKKKKPKMYIPTDKEVKDILDNCSEQFKVALTLAAYGGLRRGEICALQVEDFRDGGVYIDRDMVLNEKREWVIKDMPKTEAGVRFVPLAPDILKLVKENGIDFDFYPGSISKHLKLVQEKLGIETFSLHKLRHYCCSKLIALNISRQDIMYIMGWTNPRMIDEIYGHSRIHREKDKLKEIANKMYYG